MAGGSVAPTGVSKERAEQYQGKVTSYVIITCLVGAIGGSLFGYDIGISGKIFIVSVHFKSIRQVTINMNTVRDQTSKEPQRSQHTSLFFDLPEMGCFHFIYKMLQIFFQVTMITRVI